MKIKFTKNLIIISSVVLLLVTIGIITTLILISDNEKYRYPSVTPQLTNPDQVYLKVGNVNITNKQLYYRILTTYGLNTFNDMLDDLLLPAITDQEAFEEYRKETIAKYLEIEVEDLTEEDEEKFNNEMKLQGYLTPEYVLEMLKLDYRRYQYVLAELKKDIENFEPIKNDDDEIIQENYFTEDEYEAAKDSLFSDNAVVIFVTFRTQNEALELLNSYGIKIDNIRGWYQEGPNGEKVYLTVEEITGYFVQMYNKINAYRGATLDIQEGKVLVPDGSEAILDYTYKALSEISSVIANKVFYSLSTEKLTVNQYTTYPISYLSGFYLALKVNTPTAEELSDEELDALVMEKLIENAIDANLSSYYLYLMREAADLKIFEEGLENNYGKDITSIMNRYLAEYEGYERTTEEDGKNVASFKVGETTKYITADQLCEILIARYGVQTVVNYMNQYILFDQKYSDIYQYSTSTILNQELYDENDNTASYEKSLKNGEYAGNGFPKTYGFANYLRDYYGYLDAKELVLSGNPYSFAVEAYGKNSYTMSNEASKQIYAKFVEWYQIVIAYEARDPEATAEKIDNGLADLKQFITETLEANPETVNTIQYKVIEMYLDFFNVTGFTLGYFVDFDADWSADDLTDHPDLQLLGEELVELIYAQALADQSDEELFAKIKKVVLAYNIASVDDPTYAKFKLGGIHINFTEKSSYTNSNVENEELSALLKATWDKVRDGKDTNKDGKPIVFPTASTVTTANHALTYSWDAKSPSVTDQYFEMNNIYSRFVILSATNANWYSYIKSGSTTNKVLIPSTFEDILKLYEITLKTDAEKTKEEIEFEEKQPTLQTYQKNWIAAFYAKIVEKYESESEIGLSLADRRKVLIENGTFIFTNQADKDNYFAIIDLLLEDYKA